MDKRELLVNEWITKAEHDLGMAELVIVNKPEYKDLIGFHCLLDLLAAVENVIINIDGVNVML